MRRVMVFSAFLALMALQTTQAAVPQTVSYQGVLREANGAPVSNGDYEIVFRLYSISTGGTALWTETDTVAVQRGTFSTILGDAAAFGLPFDQAYWLGMSVEGGSELTPRTELTASPYALRAAIADSVAGLGPGGDNDWIITGNDMYAAVSGSLGIGTQSPNAKLEVNGDNEAVRASSPSSPDRWIQMLYHSSIGPLLRGGTGYDRLTIDANSQEAGKIVLGRGGDRVGIGTIDPTTNLDVVGTTKMTGFQMPTGASSGRVLTSDGSGVGTWLDPPGGGIGGSGDGNYIAKFTGSGSSTTIGNSVIYQNSSNRVGVGTTTPGYKLDVSGDIRATGTIYGTVDNADKVDGYHAGNSSGQVAVSNGTKCTNLNADKVDGYSTGNSSGDVPISNGTVCSNLNADKVDNNHVITRSIYTATSNDYVVNTSWAKIYSYGTNSSLRIENPSGSGNSLRYAYSLDYGTPTAGSLSSGSTLNVSFSSKHTLDIRVSRFSTTSDSHHITFQGVNMYNGHIRGHVIYDH